MATANGAKGNPASKRMSNKRKIENRAKSWARGEAKKKRNREANEARAAANLATLREMGGVQQTYERVTERVYRDPKTGAESIKVRTRTKLESPGSALARVRREQREAA